MFKSQTITDNTLPNIHPGIILSEDFLKPMGISAYRLAQETHIQQTRISQILNGTRRITADTAIRFSIFFGTTAEFWLNLQNAYDLEETNKKQFEQFSLIHPYSQNIPSKKSV